MMNVKRVVITFCCSILILISRNLLAIESNHNMQTSTNTELVEHRSVEQKYISIKINSSILGEERELLVNLPNDYGSTTKDYPVLYLLDGKRHFAHAIAAEDILQNESLIPSSIIVAITNNLGTRRRDLSSGKENFLNFIKQEVFSLIASKYRISKHKTLFGHSMAGAFTMDVLATQPEIFDNYIAASPVIQMNNSELINKFKHFKLSEKQLTKSLYISFGNELAEGKSATDALNAFVGLMNDLPIEGLNWKYDPMPEQVHMTTPYLTLYAGLSFSFSDYQLPRYSGLADYKLRGEMKGLKAYFEKRASKYSVTAEIPEIAFRQLGFSIFDDGEQEKGLEILELSARKHPDSLRALNALAQIYEDARQPDKALAVYKQGLKLAEEKSSSNANFFKTQIDRLNKLIQ
ncbi:alpha/beta hydrolase-fold protein [Thalassotalea ganghwensis]